MKLISPLMIALLLTGSATALAATPINESRDADPTARIAVMGFF